MKRTVKLVLLSFLIGIVFFMSSCDITGHAEVTVDSYTSRTLSIYADGSYLGTVSSYGRESFSVKITGLSESKYFTAKSSGSTYASRSATLDRGGSYLWTIR